MRHERLLARVSVALLLTGPIFVLFAQQIIRAPEAGRAKNLTRCVAPEYPKEAIEDRIEGEVRFLVVLDKKGRVRDLATISGHPLLTGSASIAVKQWDFRPIRVRGQPVEVLTTISVFFSLGPGDEPSTQPCKREAPKKPKRT